MPEMLPTAAMPVDEDVHRPPDDASESAVVAPTQATAVPEIAAGRGFMVTAAMA